SQAFGAYEYTANWVPVIGLPQGKHFPLLLPLSWWIIVGTAQAIWKPKVHVLLVPAISALSAVAVDLVLEQANIRFLHYWNWTEPQPYHDSTWGVPVVNWIGWFLVSAMLGYSLWKVSKTEQGASPRAFRMLAGFTVMMGFFALIGKAP